VRAWEDRVTYTVAGVTVARKKEEQSALPRARDLDALTSLRQLSALQPFEVAPLRCKSQP
jgi:hypothetical protein